MGCCVFNIIATFEALHIEKRLTLEGYFIKYYSDNFRLYLSDSIVESSLLVLGCLIYCRAPFGRPSSPVWNPIHSFPAFSKEIPFLEKNKLRWKGYDEPGVLDWCLVVSAMIRFITEKALVKWGCSCVWEVGLWRVWIGRLVCLC